MARDTIQSLHHSIPAAEGMQNAADKLSSNATAHRFQWLLFLSFMFCILDGAIRKWLLRDTENFWKYAPYFAKDVVFVALVIFCKPVSWSTPAKTLFRFLTIGLATSAVGVVISLSLNWQFLSPVGGFLTFRSMFLLPLLALFCIPRLQGLKIERLALLIGFFTLVNAALGTLQYSSPKDSPINYYASKEYETVVFEENVRAMGTFPYITGFTTMAIVGAWAGLVLLSYAPERKRYLWMGLLVYVGALWCALLSISRGPTIIILGLFIVWLFSARRVVENLVRVGAVIAGLALTLVFAGRFSVIQNASDVLMARTEAADDTIEQRVLFPLNDVLEVSSVAPFGAGFGSEQVGGMFIDTGTMSFRSFEGQFPRIIIEAGVLGVVGFIGVCLGLLKSLYDTKLSAPSEATRRTIVVTIFLVAVLFYGNVIFDHVASFFVWAISAAVLGSASGQSQLVTRAD